MLPTPGAFLTVITPSATFHWAGEWSWADTHSSRFLPSKRTIASEGGTALVAPGVTTLGTGVHTSVSSGLGAAGCCDERGAVRAINVAKARNFEFWERMIFNVVAPDKFDLGRQCGWVMSGHEQVGVSRFAWPLCRHGFAYLDGSILHGRALPQWRKSVAALQSI